MWINLVLAIVWLPIGVLEPTIEERPPVVWQMPLEYWDATYILRFDKTATLPKLVVEVVVPTPRKALPVLTQAPPPAPSTGHGMGDGNVEQWRAKVALYFPADQVNLALAVMNCESGGNPWAQNPAASKATGLMQVLKSWAPKFGYTANQLFDPDINLYVASLLYFDGGWRHWNASRHCWG